jgi:hypothetical protein
LSCCVLSGYSELGLVKVFWFFFSKKNAFLPLALCFFVHERADVSGTAINGGYLPLLTWS